MELRLRHYWPVALLALTLATIIGFTIRPYESNVTTLFHMDHTLGDQIALPKGFVVLGIPSYDGAQYYQVARNMPKIVNPYRWDEIRSGSPGSYAYQRFLLPLTAYIVSFGQDAALPYAFVLINVLALLGTCMLMLQWRPRFVTAFYALALCLSPAAMVAMHFTLAEPLTILLITALLIRYDNYDRIKPLDITLLSLLVLAREVNILFVLFLLGFFLLKKKWMYALWMLIPIAIFLAWHSVIYLMFNNIPFLISAGAHQLPGKAAFDVVMGNRGYDRYTISAVALCVGLVLPAIFWTADELLRRWKITMLPLGALAFLCLMAIMPDYIWGSITSIGRVITPMYPLLILHCADRDTFAARYFALATMGLGLATAIGLGMIVHPYTVM